jgi:GTP-binding protein
MVAIVGRPNVGKSSLLNCMVGRRISIVDPMPGVTRDRVSALCALPEQSEEPQAKSGGRTARSQRRRAKSEERNVEKKTAALGEGQGGPDAEDEAYDHEALPPGRYFELVDTGGVGIVDKDHLQEDVEAQIAFAMAAASLILFVTDAREGVTPLDTVVAQRLRKQHKPVILVANKIDEMGMSAQLGELHQLGFGEPLRFSANAGLGRSDLLEAIDARLGELGLHGDQAPEPVMKLAIVGKRNAGKSTFINALAGEQRVIVSETPGTTRDSVDVTIKIGDKTFTAIDTAGVRKRKSFEGDIEYYSHHRAMRSIRRADVVALMIDASLPISQVDKDLAGVIATEFKPVVLVVNKWDLATGKADPEDYQDYLEKVFPELTFAPIIFTTARNGTGVMDMVRLAAQLYKQANTRVPTARLNEYVMEILQLRGPSHRTGTKPPRILYASQISTAPPTIVCFVNDVRSFDQTYQRFLVNQLRDRLPMSEVPIRLFFNQRKVREEFRPIRNQTDELKHKRRH